MEAIRPSLEKALRASLGPDGCLADLTERTASSVDVGTAIDPWNHFQSRRLYSSAAATAALRGMLACMLPGTSASYETVLGAISKEGYHCYLVGGQVRDILRGVLSSDVDFNYSCSAKDVAVSGQTSNSRYARPCHISTIVC